MKTESKNTRYKSILKWIGFSVAVLMLLFTIASYIGANFLQKKIDQVAGLSVKKLHISWHCQSLQLKEVSYQKNKNIISFQELNFINIDWFSLINNKEIHFSEVNSSQGNINASIPQKNSQDDFLEKFDYRILIDKIVVDETDINITNKNTNFNVQNILATVENINIHKKNIQFTNVQYATAKGIINNSKSDYLFTWDHIATQQKNISISNAKLDPKISEEQWIEKYPYKNPKTELMVPKLTINKLDYNAIFKQKSLFINHITLENAYLNVLVNENKDPDPNAYKPLLNELLYNVSFPVNIHQTTLKNNRIDIEVLSKTTQNKAVIFFNKINADVMDIKNIKDHKINLKLKALVLNKNTINLDIDFWLTPSLFPYTIKGNVSPFNFEQFNTFLLLTKRVRIHSGAANRLDFTIYGNNNKADGDIILDYENIKIGLFDEDEHIVEKLPTFLINNILIKQNNIPNTEKYRTGNMYYKRPKNRSMFHSWWYTLKSGFQSVILPNIINPKELDHKTQKNE